MSMSVRSVSDTVLTTSALAVEKARARALTRPFSMDRSDRARVAASLTETVSAVLAPSGRTHRVCGCRRHPPAAWLTAAPER